MNLILFLFLLLLMNLVLVLVLVLVRDFVFSGRGFTGIGTAISELN